MYGDAIRPGLTAEQMKKKYDKRTQKYNQRWEELNKKPKIQETLQETNKAEQQEEEEREKEKTLTAWDYIRRGYRACNDGCQQDAVEEFSKAIGLNPNYAIAYYNRAIAYENIKKCTKAIEDYTRVIQLNPEYKNAYLNRADVYSVIGEEALAETDRKKAEEL